MLFSNSCVEEIIYNMTIRTSNLAFNRSALPAEWNWKADSQPEKLPNGKNYITLAKKITDAALLRACETLYRAGYIEENEIRSTLSRLKKLDAKEQLYLNGVSVKWRIKDLDSVDAKILKDGKTPDDVGDYFGLKFIGSTVNDIQRLRTAVLDDAKMTSRKCEFTYPSDRGYRSHKSHHVVNTIAGRSMTVEFMVTHAEFETIEELTHDYIALERKVLDEIKATPRGNWDKILALKKSSRDLKDSRTRLNCIAADAVHGLNSMCAPDAVIPTPTYIEGNQNSSAKNYASSILQEVAPYILVDSIATNDDRSDAQSQFQLGLG